MTGRSTSICPEAAAAATSDMTPPFPLPRRPAGEELRVNEPGADAGSIGRPERRPGTEPRAGAELRPGTEPRPGPEPRVDDEPSAHLPGDPSEPHAVVEEQMVDELEAMLRPPALEMAPYPPKAIVLASGEVMVVRPALVDEVDTILHWIQPLTWLHRDFYDIVAARLFAELLGWKVHRVRDEYCLVGAIDGVLAGIVNGRMFDRAHGISYHTLALRRGLRIGAHLFASKMEHHIEYLGQDEVWIVAESPIGHRRWMIEYPLDPKFEIQHELGGASSWVLTRETYFRAKPRLVSGSRPVSDELLRASYPIREPDLRTMLVQVEDTLEARI